jgi:hypothetical protein
LSGRLIILKGFFNPPGLYRQDYQSWGFKGAFHPPPASVEAVWGCNSKTDQIAHNNESKLKFSMALPLPGFLKVFLLPQASMEAAWGCNIETHGLWTPREERAFTAWPKILSHSQMFRYGRSIFCLPHRPNFSDIFDLCLHLVSVVRVVIVIYNNQIKKKSLK